MRHSCSHSFFACPKAICPQGFPLDGLNKIFLKNIANNFSGTVLCLLYMIQ